MKDVLRSVLTIPGELSVMMIGLLRMLKLHAGS